jgi:hypothetical protein
VEEHDAILNARTAPHRAYQRICNEAVHKNCCGKFGAETLSGSPQPSIILCLCEKFSAAFRGKKVNKEDQKTFLRAPQSLDDTRAGQTKYAQMSEKSFVGTFACQRMLLAENISTRLSTNNKRNQ